MEAWRGVKQPWGRASRTTGQVASMHPQILILIIHCSIYHDKNPLSLLAAPGRARPAPLRINPGTTLP